MIDFKRLNLLCFILLFFLTPKVTFSDNHNIYEVIELLKKDIKTLERAVYSESFSVSQETSVTSNTLDKKQQDCLITGTIPIDKEVEIINKFLKKSDTNKRLSGRLLQLINTPGSMSRRAPNCQTVLTINSGSLLKLSRSYRDRIFKA